MEQRRTQRTKTAALSLLGDSPTIVPGDRFAGYGAKSVGVASAGTVPVSRVLTRSMMTGRVGTRVAFCWG